MQHKDSLSGATLHVYRRLASLSKFVLGIVMFVDGADVLLTLLESSSSSSSSSSSAWATLSAAAKRSLSTTELYKGSAAAHRLVYAARVTLAEGADTSSCCAELLAALMTVCVK
jgi:hypothetical protein